MTEFLLILMLNGASITTTRVPDKQSCIRAGLAFVKESDAFSRFTCVEVKK